jgi:ribosomal protein S10
VPKVSLGWPKARSGPNIEITLKSFQKPFIKHAVSKILSLLGHPPKVGRKTHQRFFKILTRLNVPLLLKCLNLFQSGTQRGWQASQVNLPTKRRRWTVLRSPHIDKKSREQFEMRTLKALFRLSMPELNLSKASLDHVYSNKPAQLARQTSGFGLGARYMNCPECHEQELFLSLLRCFQSTQFLGVQLKICYSYPTNLPRSLKRANGYVRLSQLAQC